MKKLIGVKYRYYENDCTIEKSEIMEYCSEDTTVGDLLEKIPIKCHWFNPYFSNRIDSLFVRYILVNGQCQWLIPVEKCKVADFLSTFNLTEINLDYPGGLGSAGPEIIDVVKQLLEIITGLISVFKQSKKYRDKLSQWLYKSVLSANGMITYSDLEQTFIERNQWSLKDLSFMLDLDEELVKAFLEFYGFVYFEQFDLYLLVPALRDKNKKIF